MTDTPSRKEKNVTIKLTPERRAEISARIRDCKTYNFGLRNADKLAHEDTPEMLESLENLLTLVKPIVERSVGNIRTHYEGCREYHVECLAHEVVALIEGGESPLEECKTTTYVDPQGKREPLDVCTTHGEVLPCLAKGE